MKLSLLSVILCFYLFHFKILETESAKILGIAWYPAVSHQATFHPVWKELSLRGHQVTAITPVPLKDKSLTNLTEIDISFLFDVRKKSNSKEMFSKERYIWQLVLTIKHYLLDIFDQMLSNNEVQSLIQSQEKFDVVVAEPHSPLVYAFGERFIAPVVGK